jgi:hypothetical protein
VAGNYVIVGIGQITDGLYEGALAQRELVLPGLVEALQDCATPRDDRRVRDFHLHHHRDLGSVRQQLRISTGLGEANGQSERVASCRQLFGVGPSVLPDLVEALQVCGTPGA